MIRMAGPDYVCVCVSIKLHIITVHSGPDTPPSHYIPLASRSSRGGINDINYVQFSNTKTSDQTRVWVFFTLTYRTSTLPSNMRGCRFNTVSQRGTKVNESHHNVCVCMVITYSKSMGQPGKVDDPARGQLNKEKMDNSLSSFAPENLAWRDGIGSPVPRQPARFHTQAKNRSTIGGVGDGRKFVPVLRGNGTSEKSPYRDHI